VQTNCIEEVFEIAESTIKKVKSRTKDVPVVIILDSVAACAPRAEIDGTYDDNTIGLKARKISQGMRKIVQTLADNRVTFVALNQTRTKIGGMIFGDPDAPPGGKAIPYHASVRIKLGKGGSIKNDEGDTIGIQVSAKTLKNKMTFPSRTAVFQIMFGVGIREDEDLFDLLRKSGEQVVDGKGITIAGTASYKQFLVKDMATGEVICDKKFHKKEMGKVLLGDEKYRSYFRALIDKVMVKSATVENMDIDTDSYVEVQAIADLVRTGGGGLDEIS